MTFRAFAIRSSDIDRCPKRAMGANHYYEDGVCVCVRSPFAESEITVVRYVARCALCPEWSATEDTPEARDQRKGDHLHKEHGGPKRR